MHSKRRRLVLLDSAERCFDCVVLDFDGGVKRGIAVMSIFFFSLIDGCKGYRLKRWIVLFVVNKQYIYLRKRIK